MKKKKYILNPYHLLPQLMNLAQSKRIQLKGKDYSNQYPEFYNNPMSKDLNFSQPIQMARSQKTKA